MKFIKLHIKKYFATLAFVILSTALFADNLVVFVNESQPIDKHFINTYLDEIKQLADQYQLDFILKNISDGAPDEITITPQIVFQKGEEKSFYVGRYSETSRLANFIRTVRNRTPKVKTQKKQNILTLRAEKAITVLPLKITALSGSGNVTQELKDQLNQTVVAFYNGFESFELEKEVTFTKTNRAFYLDIHPYISSDDSLFLSYEIYSQFNCVEPVISKLKQPISGLWTDQKALWKTLGTEMESVVMQLITSDLNGDGFSEVPANTNYSAWPESVVDNNRRILIPVSLTSRNWQVAGAFDAKTPLIQFNFFAPLDNYAGEVKKLKGNITWESDRILSGSFTVNTKDVTMGEATYDKNVHKKYLRVFRFPLASFSFKNAEVPLSAIIENPMQAYEIEGEFTMMKKSYPVRVKASFEPFTDENENTKLLVNVNFDVNIFEKFNINGPDGPADAKSNMHFAMTFLMNSK
ncbi:MAG: YceI family protein [Bacteroidota bacterium]